MLNTLLYLRFLGEGNYMISTLLDTYARIQLQPKSVAVLLGIVFYW